MNDLTKWVSTNPQIAAALIAAISGLIGSLVGPLVKRVATATWDLLRGRMLGKSFQQRYLQTVIREHQYLPMLPTTLVPITHGPTTELDRLYVALTLTKAASPSHRNSIDDALRANRAVVILGDPGAGKTTILRFLALTFARARLNSTAAAPHDRATEKARIAEARETVRHNFGLANFPVPVLLYLNRIREAVDRPPNRSILDVVCDEWRSVPGFRELPNTFLTENIAAGQCIFLLDAFDELPTSDARHFVARLIGELASTAPAGNRFVVTSRVVGYQGQLGHYGFETFKIERLSWNLITVLVRNWYESLGEPALSDTLIATLRENPGVCELAVNPMLLSLIALVQYVKRVIPERRHLLYDECVKILLERRYASPPVQNAFNSILPADEALDILRWLAYSFHTAHARELPRSQIENALLPQFLASLFKSKAASLQPKEIVQNIEDRSQLIVERGFDERGMPIMAFSHLTFQEYLTSLEFRQQASRVGESTVSSELLRLYTGDPHWWEEVALLYAAQLDLADRDPFFQRIYAGRDRSG
jgi:predicted NACHT family NTPase